MLDAVCQVAVRRGDGPQAGLAARKERNVARVRERVGISRLEDADYQHGRIGSSARVPQGKVGLSELKKIGGKQGRSPPLLTPQQIPSLMRELYWLDQVGTAQHLKLIVHISPGAFQNFPFWQ